MNAAQVKQQITIIGFLASRGIEPVRVTGDAYWYCSPVRDERTASFEVSGSRNIWRDHGTGEGGDLIKLVQLLFNVEVSGALDILAGSKKSSLFCHQQKEYPKPCGVEVKCIRELQNRTLISYAESRGIPALTARLYLKECFFRTPNQTSDRDMFALVFANDLGGYELRNSMYKGSISPKAPTTMKGSQADTVAVFEGFFDFLSAMVHFSRKEPVTDVIVLNSVGNVSACLEQLQAYSKINLFLDNDSAGAGATKQISESVRGRVVDWSKSIYPDHPDFNSFLTDNNHELFNS